MLASQHIHCLQIALDIPEGQRAARIGPLTRRAFESLAAADPDSEWPGAAPAADLGHPGGANARDISQKGVDLIQHFESYQQALEDGSCKAYRDEVGVWTIGWGHTGLQHEDGTVYPGRVISRVKAVQLFRYDMEQFEARVEALVKVPLNDDQHAALVAWDFNTGGLGRSTLLEKLNAGDYQGAADQFLMWTKAGGRVLSGLVRRRRSERRLFLGKVHYLLADMGEVRRDEEGLLD